jgi:RNA polymerase sigma-70 factor (ECF subfamily)
MIVVRMDPRLGRRVDPSDVVQDTMAIALRRLPRYLRDEPVPFYPWLRAIAWNRLIDLHRKHIRAAQRTVDRERPEDLSLGNRSALILAERLCGLTSAPSARLIREELRDRVRNAMLQLPETLREVLVLRHLEEMSVGEVAAVTEVSEGTVKSRHFRALARLREILESD